MNQSGYERNVDSNDAEREVVKKVKSVKKRTVKKSVATTKKRTIKKHKVIKSEDEMMDDALDGIL